MDNSTSPAELNYGLDREIDEQPPGLEHLGLIDSTGSASPGRRNARAQDPSQEAATAFNATEFFQNYGGLEPTNAVNANDLLYATSDRQPVMPMEITGSWVPPGHYWVKVSADLDYSGLFTTDQLDPRMPESQQNLLNQPFQTGMGLTQDLAVSKMFEDLKVMGDSQTMNTQGDGAAGATMSGKEAALQGRIDAQRRYGLWP